MSIPFIENGLLFISIQLYINATAPTIAIPIPTQVAVRNAAPPVCAVAVVELLLVVELPPEPPLCGPPVGRDSFAGIEASLAGNSVAVTPVPLTQEDGTVSLVLVNVISAHCGEGSD